MRIERAVKILDAPCIAARLIVQRSNLMRAPHTPTPPIRSSSYSMEA